MTLDLSLAATILAPVFFLAWWRWRRSVRRRLKAWNHCPGYLEIKFCPRCGSAALEGEIFCLNCGHQPEDDTTWRELSQASFNVEVGGLYP